MNKLLIYDDDRGFSQECLDNLKEIKEIDKNFELKTLNDNFKEIFNELIDRQKKSRKEDPIELTLNDLDECSIFIIDYDLIENTMYPFLTGERVAYLAKNYSTCGIIIGLNKYNKLGENYFDLKLNGYLNSFCDLNVSNIQLYNHGLWGKDVDGFRPWHWPNLFQYIENFEIKVDEVKKNLTESIVQTLGITDIIPKMPNSIVNFLGNNPNDTTFQSLLYDSIYGLEQKDQIKNEDIIAKASASRISRWLDRMVLPCQDVLIDAPHIVSQYPSIIDTDDYENIDNWNKTAKLLEFIKLGIRWKDIEKFRYKKNYWISRPVWKWFELYESEEILENKTPYKRIDVDYVFCEDYSRFWNRKESKGFRIKLDTTNTFRYIKKFEDVVYEPKVRFYL